MPSEERSGSDRKAKKILETLDIVEKDEKATGIRHRKVATEGDDEVITRCGDPLKSTKENPGWWLTTIQIEDLKEDDSKVTTWEIRVADEQVIACMRKTINDYLVHTGTGLTWREDHVILKSDFVPIAVNWSRLKQLSAMVQDENVAPSKVTGTVASEQPSAGGYSRQTYERISLVLRYVQQLRPRPIEILEQNPDEIEFKYSWALFRPGRLVVSTWSQDSVKYPQVFKVSNFQVVKSGTTSAFVSIDAWMFDWNGSDVDRTLYRFSVHNFEIASGASVKPVKSLEVYPIEYYTDGNGKSGIEAIHAHEVYQDRRKKFIEYAVNGEGTRSSLRLHYSGDVLYIGSTGLGYTQAAKKAKKGMEEVLTLDDEPDSIRRVKVSSR